MEMDWNVLIAQSHPIVVEMLMEWLVGSGFRVLPPVSSPEEVYNILNRESNLIVLLDIHLKAVEDGFPIAMRLKERNTPFMFITGDQKLSTLEKSMQFDPLGYLVMPVKGIDLHAALMIGLERLEAVSREPEKSDGLVRDCIFIRFNGQFRKIKVSTITWIKSSSNYLELYTVEAKYVIRGSLNTISQRLPRKSFFQVHRSFLVNLDHVTGIGNGKVVLGKEELPLARNFRADLLNQITRF